MERSLLKRNLYLLTVLLFLCDVTDVTSIILLLIVLYPLFIYNSMIKQVPIKISFVCNVYSLYIAIRHYRSLPKTD